MRFVVDECLFRFIVDALKVRGHDVTCAKEENPGLDDFSVLANAMAAGQMAVTADRGFGQQVVQLKQPAIGVVIISVGDFELELKGIAEHASSLMTGLGDQLCGSLTVIRPKRVRQRRLEPSLVG